MTDEPQDKAPALPKGCTENDDGSVTIDLRVPVMHGSEQIERMTLKRLKGKHMRALGGGMEKAGMAEILSLAGRVSGLPPVVVDELDAVDCVVVAEVIGGFFESGPRTGGPS